MIAALILSAALSANDCTRMWLVRFLYQYPVFTPVHSWRWLYVETAPVVERSEADATRREIERDGYTVVNPFCPNPSECSEDHIGHADIRFPSVKQVCCKVPPPGPQMWPCEYVDTLPPPFPFGREP